MYILIGIEINNNRNNKFVSKTKKKLEIYIKEIGYYWSKNNNCYVNDKNCGIDGGSGVDYIIDKINEL